eukprot:Platyproteum_vivax@DN271_c0_g1_i1.p1
MNITFNSLEEGNVHEYSNYSKGSSPNCCTSKHVCKTSSQATTVFSSEANHSLTSCSLIGREKSPNLSDYGKVECCGDASDSSGLLNPSYPKCFSVLSEAANSYEMHRVCGSETDTNNDLKAKTNPYPILSRQAVRLLNAHDSSPQGRKCCSVLKTSNQMKIHSPLKAVNSCETLVFEDGLSDRAVCSTSTQSVDSDCFVPTEPYSHGQCVPGGGGAVSANGVTCEIHTANVWSERADLLTKKFHHLEEMCIEREAKCCVLESHAAQLSRDLGEARDMAALVIADHQSMVLAHHRLQSRLLLLLEGCSCNLASNCKGSKSCRKESLLSSSAGRATSVPSVDQGSGPESLVECLRNYAKDCTRRCLLLVANVFGGFWS